MSPEDQLPKLLRQVLYVESSLSTVRSVATSIGDAETLARCDQLADGLAEIADLVVGLRRQLDEEET